MAEMVSSRYDISFPFKLTCSMRFLVYFCKRVELFSCTFFLFAAVVFLLSDLLLVFRSLIVFLRDKMFLDVLSFFIFLYFSFQEFVEWSFLFSFLLKLWLVCFCKVIFNVWFSALSFAFSTFNLLFSAFSWHNNWTVSSHSVSKHALADCPTSSQNVLNFSAGFFSGWWFPFFFLGCGTEKKLYKNICVCDSIFIKTTFKIGGSQKISHANKYLFSE